MDYPFWLTITAGLILVVLIGGGALIAVKCRPKRTGWSTSEDTRTQLERDLDEIFSGSGMSDW